MKDIPQHWQAVSHGMSGVWVERNVECLDSRAFHGDRMDVIHVPAWDLHYETDVGVFTTDLQIQIALMMFSWGRSRGIEIGQKQALKNVRIVLGIEE